MQGNASQYIQKINDGVFCVFDLVATFFKGNFMNKKVLNVMIWLTWGILAFFLIAKLFFGEWYAIVITNEKLVNIGIFIDTHFWVTRAVAFCTTFITYWLYLCACSRQWYLKWKQIAWILPILLALQVLKYFAPTQGSVIDYCLMLVLPYFLKAEYKSVAFVFTCHCLSQMVVAYVRNLPILTNMYNSATILILCIDTYFWLLLYYFYQNKYKKEN